MSYRCNAGANPATYTRLAVSQKGADTRVVAGFLIQGAIVELKELAELVEKMRTTQRAYFRARKPEVLEESKRLEREVDEAIKKILHDEQPTLF